MVAIELPVGIESIQI